jgi:hypothetical protein
VKPLLGGARAVALLNLVIACEISRIKAGVWQRHLLSVTVQQRELESELPLKRASCAQLRLGVVDRDRSRAAAG